ncbi:MAG TPA: Maf family nucleotide pyrophosphatase, partial [Puia sp.]|nr:Maf family nucleotide pyrophosphatase [Puia sp.]
MDRIVLASRSPRRKQLLEWAEIDFDVIVHETDESYPADLPVEKVPVHIARNKALAVGKTLDPGRMVVAADTVVVLNNEIIGKPVDRAEAIRILTRLSGKKHLVITGVVMMRNGRERALSDSTEVWFHELTPAQIEFYVDNYKPYDKAGAYAIQEWIGV